MPAHDYSRPADGNDDFCYLGHAIEALMVMAVAEERSDEALYAARPRSSEARRLRLGPAVRRHLPGG